jgi:TPR repeat protein
MNHQNFHKSYNLWKEASAQGLKEGNIKLAACYFHFAKFQLPNEPDYVKAHSNKASRKDMLDGYYWLSCYEEKYGSKTKAFDIYMELAARKHTDGQFLLGLAYYYGWGDEQSQDQSYYWMLVASEKADLRLMNLIAPFFYNPLEHYPISWDEIAEMKVRAAARESSEISLFELTQNH